MTHIRGREMAQRTEALCDGKIIGIESIYTVLDGKNINIPEKIKVLRDKSQKGELFCPCGCGANLTLVAGDRGLREQHFRIKDPDAHPDCIAQTEGFTSLNSKIVLKCWLDEKLAADDLESRVPIYSVGDIERKYEFSFLTRSRKIAVNYSHERENLTDEKIDILEQNGKGIHIIHIVDSGNSECTGQYPENMMKVQNHQGYCLFLTVADSEYAHANLKATFYGQGIDQLWVEVPFAEDLLSAFDLIDSGDVIYHGESLRVLLNQARLNWTQTLEWEKQRLLEAKKEAERKQREADDRQQKLKEEITERLERNEKERLLFGTEIYAQPEQLQTSSLGNRLVTCIYCGKKANDGEFSSYGGDYGQNKGVCRDCYDKPEVIKQREDYYRKILEENKRTRAKENPMVCPWCGGKLIRRSGRFGDFFGCSEYPNCRYTQNC